MCVMDDATVVQDDLSREGLRRVHVLSGRVDAIERAKAGLWQKIPWESAGSARLQSYTEAGIHHLWLYWPVRGEPVSVAVDGAETAGAIPLPKDDLIVLWIMATGKKRADDEERGRVGRLSQAVEMSAWRYMAHFGVWPDTAWAGERLAKYAGQTVRVHDRRIEIVTGLWMPRAGIGVGVRREGGEK